MQTLLITLAGRERNSYFSSARQDNTHISATVTGLSQKADDR